MNAGALVHYQAPRYLLLEPDVPPSSTRFLLPLTAAAAERPKFGLRLLAATPVF